ncbi:protein-methionine-sulfoxide reductase heme-binding subunit MsrQ [Pseudorhodoplanes sp.]|uniref:sulfite oxidase heme-binding subunit YedZ n=1 Tax=Pseudorhodoplanes sp. TaxID=1934341 RepID=UPI002CB093F9|nr:protein-methionine-sulfoxide reductase heme-binding subunit MsrQ [Pseudorhodoplanes sp.]HWV54494.1 protein-methionine-sulfoxide reductase heme-binding subunit MsrQ [Pseudorhodoplanes sp.]
MTTHGYQLWRDRRGRISPLRIAALVLMLVPAMLAAYAWYAHMLAPRVLNDLVHRTGYWALIFVLISLAITPLRRSGRFAGLIDVRRMIGVGAFIYATLHILLYIADERFDLIKVALEIVKRLYLTIGLVAWIGLLALAVTSNDTMVKRLGAVRWRRLHRVTYVVGFLALIHFFQQTKADFTLPATITGLFGWLMVYRAVAAWKGPELSTLALFVMTLGVALATFLGEAAGIALWYKVSPMTVLSTVFDFDLAIRPGWYVLGAGLAVCLLDLVRSYGQAPRGRSAATAARGA